MMAIMELPARPYAGAFEAAVVANHRRLAGLAYAMCGDRHLAEELVAEAYARVWPKWKNRQVDDLEPYLRRALVNLVQSRRRRRLIERREQERHKVDWRDGLQFEDSIDVRGPLWTALMCLPVDQRAVVVLRHVMDLSESEVAKALSLRPGTVKSRLSRALDALRAQLGEEVG